MNELRVSAWPIDKVIPFARNARKISAVAVAKVAASIKEFGWRQPIVVDREGVIICGIPACSRPESLALIKFRSM